MTICSHRGDLVGTYSLGGQTLEAHRCDLLNKQCAESDNQLNIINCHNCSFISRGTDWMTCQKRGQAIDLIDAPGCGCDRTIYACQIKGKCLKKLPTARTAESLGSQMDGVTVCKSCEVPLTT